MLVVIDEIDFTCESQSVMSYLVWGMRDMQVPVGGQHHKLCPLLPSLLSQPLPCTVFTRCWGSQAFVVLTHSLLALGSLHSVAQG